MANRSFKTDAGSLHAGVVKLFGSFVTSTSGTISSSSARGFSIAKTGSETGRYTITLEDPYLELLNCQAVVVGADDAGYTSGKGLLNFIRNVDVSSSSKTFYLQFVDEADPQADAELEDAAQVLIEITLRNAAAN